jgi:endogenous inhibitor of DNA gyrase (YacG/DUF329 family)
MSQTGQKRCGKCGQMKPLEQFYAARDCAGGRRPECKRCANAYHNSWARGRYVPARRGRYRKAEGAV